MKIITTPDPRLRERSEKVGAIDEAALDTIAKMRQLSLAWEKEHPYELSAAMAAPQIGVNKRIIIVRDDMEDKKKADRGRLFQAKERGYFRLALATSAKPAKAVGSFTANSARTLRFTSTLAFFRPWIMVL